MKQRTNEKITKTLVVSVIFGLLSSFVGTFFIFSFFAPTELFTEKLNIESQNQEFLKTSLGIKAYGRLEVFEFLDKSLPAVATIYKRKVESSVLIDNIYIDKDKIGYGFVLTSDGWIVSNANVLGGYGIAKVSISIGDKIYLVNSIVSDVWTDIVFLKVDAKDLPVVVLGNSDTLSLGDVVFTGSGKNNFWFSYVNSLGSYKGRQEKSDVLISSEKFGKVIKLQDSLPKEMNGTMISNRNGEIVGLAFVGATDNYIVPVNQFKNIINDVLKNQKIVRPYLGVNYIDLNSILLENSPYKKGAYIYGGGILRSVEANSPAYKAGMKTGDIILEVDGELLSGQKNLGEIISEFIPEEAIKLKVLRNNEEVEISVVLAGK